MVISGGDHTQIPSLYYLLNKQGLPLLMAKNTYTIFTLSVQIFKYLTYNPIT